MFRSLGVVSALATFIWLQSSVEVPKGLFALTSTSAQEINVNSSEISPDKTITHFSFDPTQRGEEAQRWRNVDDTVMGGISQGDITLTAQGTGVFSGVLSLENNGGFSSVRRDTSDYDFSGVSRVAIRVRGDGRRYQLRLQTRDADRVTYRAAFDTVADEWQTLSFAFDDFEPVFRGQVVDSAPTLSADGIYQVGFLIADKKRGEFNLEIDWIGAE